MRYQLTIKRKEFNFNNYAVWRKVESVLNEINIMLQDERRIDEIKTECTENAIVIERQTIRDLFQDDVDFIVDLLREIDVDFVATEINEKQYYDIEIEKKVFNDREVADKVDRALWESPRNITTKWTSTELYVYQQTIERAREDIAFEIADILEENEINYNLVEVN